MKQLFITLLMFLILCGCDSLTDNESKSEENTKSNELKESTESNELSGKTFSNNDVKFSFENSTVKQSSNEASRSVNWTDIADFNYTFNSKSEPKLSIFNWNKFGEQALPQIMKSNWKLQKTVIKQ